LASPRLYGLRHQPIHVDVVSHRERMTARESTGVLEISLAALQLPPYLLPSVERSSSAIIISYVIMIIMITLRRHLTTVHTTSSSFATDIAAMSIVARPPRFEPPSLRPSVRQSSSQVAKAGARLWPSGYSTCMNSVCPRARSSDRAWRFLFIDDQCRVDGG
jgi:hypothetical protein